VTEDPRKRVMLGNEVNANAHELVLNGLDV
jgi:hypothetical protein